MYCGSTAVLLRYYCGTTAALWYYRSIFAVLVLQYFRGTCPAVLSQYLYCSTTAVLLRYYRGTNAVIVL